MNKNIMIVNDNPKQYNGEMDYKKVECIPFRRAIGSSNSGVKVEGDKVVDT